MAQQFPYGFVAALAVGVASSGAQVTLATPEYLWVWQAVTWVSFATAFVFGGKGIWDWAAERRATKRKKLPEEPALPPAPPRDPHLERVGPQLITMFGELRSRALSRGALSAGQYAHAIEAGTNIRAILDQFPRTHPMASLANDHVQICYIVMEAKPKRENVEAERAEAEQQWAELYPMLTGTTPSASPSPLPPQDTAGRTRP